eukprot:TRINITY_DN7623_c0_g2_i1.p1 TRINITY_DN7623_c0_g2~~TRINITY_DN7623_c0_g2_i1.p1  ORF type:complete len:339 (+),score=73.15 TRINITY_DN7623_c0_g2_i1:65-1018(+)
MAGGPKPADAGYANATENGSAAAAQAKQPTTANAGQQPASKAQQLANLRAQPIDLHRSAYEELQVARIYTRNRTEMTLANGYNSEDDDSDEDEIDGKLFTEKHFHDNGQPKFKRTYLRMPARGQLPANERVVEEKHYSPEGVCMLDVHFGLGQPYLSRKHFHHNQRMKSEKLFFVEDERTMKCRKAGWWRTYYEGGNVESEMQYDHNGVRVGFCKRYAEDGTILWCKDYTKDYIERAQEVNSKSGSLEFSVEEAAKLLGFPQGRLPKSAHEVNREYRRQCALLHPDKSDDPHAADRFVEASRARDLLLSLFPGSAED